MSSDCPGWVVPVMRAGYAARAAVYLILGGLAVTAAVTGGAAEGTKGALASLRGMAFGTALLWVIALGLVCYGIWRLIAAALDLERRGDDEGGLIARAALVVTGLAHIALGASVAGLALGKSSGGSNEQDWTASLMALPFGKWIAAGVGLAIAGAGLYYISKGWQRKYERHIRVTATTRKLDPALRAGFVAYGTVIGLVGAFLLIAALRSDPSEAKGVGDALNALRSMTFGSVLLGLIGLGLLGFALENLVEAIYRIVPGQGGGNSRTLADFVEREGRKAMN